MTTKTRFIAVTSLTAACLLATGIPAQATAANYPTPSPTNPVLAPDMTWEVVTQPSPARDGKTTSTPASSERRCENQAKFMAKRKAIRKKARRVENRGKTARATELRKKARSMKRCKTVHTPGSQRTTGTILEFLPPERVEVIGCTWTPRDATHFVWTKKITYRIVGGQFYDTRSHSRPGQSTTVVENVVSDPAFWGMEPGPWDPRGGGSTAILLVTAYQDGDGPGMPGRGFARLRTGHTEITCN
jgi:hypothetical protein